MVLWMNRRGITPPPFVAWTLGAWTMVDAVIVLLTPLSRPLSNGRREQPETAR